MSLFSLPRVKTEFGSFDPVCASGENSTSKLNYSDRPALFTDEKDEEGKGEWSADMVVEKAGHRGTMQRSEEGAKENRNDGK